MGKAHTPHGLLGGSEKSIHHLRKFVYQTVKDNSVFVKFKLKNELNTYILSWTTTPWTLPGNVALAVGEKIEYIKVKVGEEFYILAKERLSILDNYEIIEEFKGSDLVGLEYEPLFPYLSE